MNTHVELPPPPFHTHMHTHTHTHNGGWSPNEGGRVGECACMSDGAVFAHSVLVPHACSYPRA